MSRRQIRFIVGLAALHVLGATVVRAQDNASGSPIAGDAESLVAVATFRDVSSVESWSFFEPAPPGGDPTYTMFANRARLAVGVRSRHLDLDGAFQYSTLGALPRHAVGPGPLGPGAIYLQSANATSAYQLYIKAMSLRVKSTRGVSFEGGRMTFSSGLERDSGDGDLEALKRSRLGERLAGTVEWTPFERAFDGARVVVRQARWQITGASLFPSQGVFEESANPTIGRLRTDTVSFSFGTARPPASAALPTLPLSPESASPSWEAQAFAYRYDDRRAISGRPDNSGLGAVAADIQVLTFGASHIGSYPVRGGRIDSVVWFAGQSGRWYSDDERAFSAVVEGGYRSEAAWQPWVRGGYSIASGDDDPRDGVHRTFFPMLPTTHPAVLAGTFAAMNLRDLFGEVILQPRCELHLKVAVHQLTLANDADRWYSGTGATASRGAYFGFSARSSAGATGLGTLVHTSAEFPIVATWSLKADLAVMRGGDVVRRQFAGNRLAVLTIESTAKWGK